MMSYSKIFGISIVSSLLFLSIFVITAFDSENKLREAYNKYAEKDYISARAILLNEDISIPLADFYLYEGYLAREELGLKKSQSYLNQAYNELRTKKSSAALEISLNLALNAFLQNDLNNLQIAIEQSRSQATPEEYSWVYFFEGCLAYLNKDYQKAEQSWIAAEKRKYLSNWMKTSFSVNLPNEKIEHKRLHAGLETDSFWLTRKKLEQELANGNESENIRFLMALSYIKECEKVACHNRCFLYKNAHHILATLNPENELWNQEKQQILNTHKDQLVNLVQIHSFDNLAFYTTALENWEAYAELATAAKEIAKIIEDNEPLYLLSLVEGLHEGHFKNLLLQETAQILAIQITNGQLWSVAQNWNIYESFFSGSVKSLSVISNAANSHVFELIHHSGTTTEQLDHAIAFWLQLEKSPYNRLVMAQQIVHVAQRIWSIDAEGEKAIHLMKLARNLPYNEDQLTLLNEIEKAIVKTYRQAILQDHVHSFPYVLIAIQEFNLHDRDILDHSEPANQLADAQYLLMAGKYAQAAQKSYWVLLLEPGNLQAQQIIDSIPN